jgi:hypothetical protein
MFGARAHLQPGAEESVDLGFVGLREAATELLALHREAVLAHRKGQS